MTNEIHGQPHPDDRDPRDEQHYYYLLILYSREICTN